jgi:hypothetical protein
MILDGAVQIETRGKPQAAKTANRPAAAQHAAEKRRGKPAA